MSNIVIRTLVGFSCAIVILIAGLATGYNHGTNRVVEEMEGNYVSIEGIMASGLVMIGNPDGEPIAICMNEETTQELLANIEEDILLGPSCNGGI